jgi:predicted HAD superfamily Cof-like phosphohydrolase
MSNDMFRDVKSMHRKFGFPVRETPGFLDDEHQKVRLNFMLEELLETAKACGFSLAVTINPDADFTEDQASFSFEREEGAEQNLAEALDGLHDLVYVALGTSDLMGMHAEVSDAAVDHNPFAIESVHQFTWDRVHSANMNKVRVEHAHESKRGTTFDLRKPQGWTPPRYEDVHNAFEQK